MTSFESLKNEIPEQCKGCDFLSSYLECSQQSSERFTEWAVGRAAPALDLPTTQEDAQQVELSELRAAGSDAYYINEISDNEFERRIALSYLASAAFREEQMIAADSEMLAALADECVGQAACVHASTAIDEK